MCTLQVFSAICVVFAHGAGEVGFMTGPLSCVYDVYMNGHLSTSLSPPIWTLLIGALSLVIGLATYGAWPAGSAAQYVWHFFFWG